MNLTYFLLNSIKYAKYTLSKNLIFLILTVWLLKVDNFLTVIQQLPVIHDLMLILQHGRLSAHLQPPQCPSLMPRKTYRLILASVTWIPIGDQRSKLLWMLREMQKWL